MAETADYETAAKDNFVPPANHSESLSIPYSSPQSEGETSGLFDVKVNFNNKNEKEEQMEFTDNVDDLKSVTELNKIDNSSVQKDEIDDKISLETGSTNHILDDRIAVSSTELESKVSNDKIDSDDKIFCKPDDICSKFEKSPRELRSPRSDRSGKSPKYSPRSETSPHPDRSPKSERSPKSDRSPKPERSPKSSRSPKLESSPKANQSSKTDRTSKSERLKMENEITGEINIHSKEEIDKDVLKNSGCKNGAIKRSRNRSDNSKSKKKINNNTASRGRPPKLRDTLLTTTYHSQISGDKNAIKICIKKANLVPQMTPTNKKSRKRKRQKHYMDSDGSDLETNYTSKKHRSSGKSRDKTAVEKESKIEEDLEPIEQSVWGSSMPENVLLNIFHQVCNDVGCLPTLVRLSKVCKLWRCVAQTAELWTNVDLSTWHKERQKNDYKLIWLIDNRLSRCQELNISNWKANNISLIFQSLTEKCTELEGVNLSGWNGLTSDHLKQITNQCKKLKRLDLSSINSETTITKCAIGSQPLMQLADDMGSRLTHLLLANNKLAGFPQIISAISTHCPNLQLLDLSNIKTVSHTTAPLHVEKLQQGCEKLRVLRITNSQIVLGSASLKEQVESPGFPNLEELSVATGSSDVTLIDDNAIERILKSSHKLRLLDVRGCTRISDSSLVRVPAWDLEHLFLSGCYVTRFTGSGLELIAQKWSHSLLELDLGWSTATEPLDAAVMALAEKEDDSRLRILNLCGSSVSLEPVKAVLRKCKHLHSINLSSCRALPRGIKRLYEGAEVAELLSGLEEKPKKVEEPPQAPLTETAVSSPSSLEPIDEISETPAILNSTLEKELLFEHQQSSSVIDTTDLLFSDHQSVDEELHSILESTE